MLSFWLPSLGGACAMRYAIWAKSQDSAPFQAEGRWVVEATSREEAIKLMEKSINFWPKGSTWTVKPWTPDNVKTSDRRGADAGRVFTILVRLPAGFAGARRENESS
jgi:hypothetical protein